MIRTEGRREGGEGRVEELTGPKQMAIPISFHTKTGKEHLLLWIFQEGIRSIRRHTTHSSEASYPSP